METFAHKIDCDMNWKITFMVIRYMLYVCINIADVQNVITAKTKSGKPTTVVHIYIKTWKLHISGAKHVFLFLLIVV